MKSLRTSAPGAAPEPSNHPSNSSSGKRVALHTLGCRLNQSETATLASSLTTNGYKIVDMKDTPDICIINSCSVTADAEADCRKAVRQLMRRSPKAYVVVTGCYAQVGYEALCALDGIDMVVGSSDKLRLAEILNQTSSFSKRSTAKLIRQRPGSEDFQQEDSGLYLGQTRANLKIQDGCNEGCSFCIIPQTRGRARSRDFDNTLAEARQLILAGHRELVLTGVNLGSYSSGDRSFADLLRALDPLPGLDRLRISSIEPTTVTREVLDVMRDSSRICKHLHIPVQSANDAILGEMRRPYTRSDFEQVVEMAQSRLPDLALGTDVLVGFPGEDESAFEETGQLVRDLPFAYLHVFSYSPRPGTRANRMSHSVPQPVVRQRSRLLRDLDQRLRRNYGQQFVGKIVDVLFEEQKTDGNWVGLTTNYLRVGVDPGRSNHLEWSNQIRRVEILHPDGARWQGRLV